MLSSVAESFKNRDESIGLICRLRQEKFFWWQCAMLQNLTNFPFLFVCFSDSSHCTKCSATSGQGNPATSTAGHRRLPEEGSEGVRGDPRQVSEAAQQSGSHPTARVAQVWNC